jgi:uncharacterized protein (TIGR02996 family)
MSDPRAALEARLRANLDDDEAWRVYGDLLLDQGDRRGELIMLSLLQREQPQLAARVEALADELREAAPQARGTWKYGFLVGAQAPLRVDDPLEFLHWLLTAPTTTLVRHVALEIPAELPEAELDGLAELDWSRIRSLRCADQPRGSAVVAALARTTTRFEALELQHSELDLRGMRALARVAEHGTLRRLSLQRNAIAGEGLAELVPMLVGLELLDLRYVALELADARALAGAPALASLHTLRVDLHRLHVYCVQALAESTTLPRHITRLFRGVADPYWD